MDVKTKVEELDDLYTKVKDIYKEAGWRRKYFPFLAKHDESFNKKASSLEEEVNSNIRGLEEELGINPGTEGIVPYLTLAVKTEDYKTRFDFGPNFNNFGRKLCYGMSGGYAGGLMVLKGLTSESGYPNIGLTALGVLAGFAVSFLMEGYTYTTHHWEENGNIKERIKDIKKEFKKVKEAQKI